MDLFIGTSGWSYDWNEGKSLEWYVNSTGLNAIELNMSFYRYPYPNMVKSWLKKGKNLAWVVKVHRSITHYKKLGKDSYENFIRFRNIFKPLEKFIHYYLLQLPPSFNNIDVLENFIDECNCDKLCVEFRNISFFNDDIIKWGYKKGILIVSVDAPKIPSIIMSDKVVYERVHGRNNWYSHDYSNEELLEIKNRILIKKPDKVYVFFNNDEMLENVKNMNNLFL
jgi:uncharacterized protein YecE (DUF72 family)